MKILGIFFIMVLLGTTGCSGIKFAPAQVNHPLPETFTKRAVYHGAVAGYEFQDLVGNILYLEEQKDPLRIAVIKPSKYRNEVIIISSPNNSYRSRIQKGAEVHGSYLAFAANFNADDMAELILVDVARAAITFEDPLVWAEIQNNLVKWVKAHPLENPMAKRLWIKSTVLTSRVYNGYTKIDANASGQIGEVTGVKTGVYHKSENDVKSVIIGFEAFDVDKLAEQIASVESSPFGSFMAGIDFEQSVDINYLNHARNSGLINGVIKN